MASPPVDQSNGAAPFDTIFSALADETRRHVLRYFWSSSEAVVPIEDLIDHTLALKGTRDDPARLAIEFHHATLPMLADAGLLEYDERSKFVTYRENQRAEAVLSLVTEIEECESMNR